MSFFRKSEVKTLSQWLEIATSKLSTPAKERIKVEIEAHYEESVQSHEEDGFSNDEAQMRALSELGDAKTAARRFRKSDLTNFEAGILLSSQETGRSKLVFLACCFVFCAFTYDQFPLLTNDRSHGFSPLLFFVLEFSVLVAFPTICFALSKDNWSVAKSLVVILLQAISGLTMGVMIHGLFRDYQHTTGGWMFVPICLVPLGRVVIALRIWRKLGFGGRRQNHLPPFETPTPE